MAVKAFAGLMRRFADENTQLTEDESDAINLWFDNGGDVTHADFLTRTSEELLCVWDYMCSMPIYKEVEAGGKQFVLVHGGLENFTVSRPLSDYSASEMLWHRPKPRTKYYPDKCVIVGHTPVCMMHKRTKLPMHKLKIFHGKNFIDIDCGCVFGGRLGCLCLDTMEEIYI